MRASHVAVGAVLLAGCAGLLGDRITHYEMAPRLEYQGFSFDRPPNSNWYIQHSEQTHTEVTLRRELSSPTHSFYAIVALAKLERQPSSHEEFAELARSKGQKAPYPTRDLSQEHKLVTLQNQWCIRVETLSAQTGAPPSANQDLHLIVRGFRCLHPTWPQTSLDFFYSERGLPEEIDPELSEEGEAFLKGVRIDVAPGTPAT